MFNLKTNPKKNFIPKLDLKSPLAPLLLVEYIKYAELKELIDNIHSLVKENKYKTIATLSEFNNEGKSFFTLTLALGFTKFFRDKILIIDSSIENTMYDHFIDPNLESTKTNGPKSSIFHNLDIAIIRNFTSQYGELTEYEISVLAKEYAEEYSIVIIDTVCYGARNKNNNHPLVLAKRCDASILVMSSTPTQKRDLEHLQNSIKESNINLIGLVYNEG